MTKEEWNTRLYQRLFDEQVQYEKWLLTLPAAQVLDQSYEYRIREDIILALEYMNLTKKECRAMLEQGITLRALFLEFEELETDHMDNVRGLIRDNARRLILKGGRNNGNATDSPKD